MKPDPRPAAPSEELNGFYVVHAALRKGGSDLENATARFATTPLDPAVLGRLWGFYSRGLRHHHNGEDDVVFPLVRSRQPDFAGIEADLRRDHHAIDELLDAADTAFAGLTATAGPAPARRANGILVDLNQALDAHLTREEAEALPVIASVISEPEMTKIEKRLLRELPKRDLGLSLAALEATTKEHPELHLPPVPKPALVLLALVWRRQYAKLMVAVGS